LVVEVLKVGPAFENAQQAFLQRVLNPDPATAALGLAIEHPLQVLAKRLGVGLDDLLIRGA
jgi:hypothetical protein